MNYFKLLILLLILIMTLVSCSSSQSYVLKKKELKIDSIFNKLITENPSPKLYLQNIKCINNKNIFLQFVGEKIFSNGMEGFHSNSITSYWVLDLKFDSIKSLPCDTNMYIPLGFFNDDIITYSKADKKINTENCPYLSLYINNILDRENSQILFSKDQKKYIIINFKKDGIIFNIYSIDNKKVIIDSISNGFKFGTKAFFISDSLILLSKYVEKKGMFEPIRELWIYNINNKKFYPVFSKNDIYEIYDTFVENGKVKILVHYENLKYCIEEIVLENKKYILKNIAIVDGITESYSNIIFLSNSKFIAIYYDSFQNKMIDLFVLEQ